MPITFSPKEITGIMKSIKESGLWSPEEYGEALESVKNWMAGKPGSVVDIPEIKTQAENAIKTGQWGTLATLLKTASPAILTGAAVAGAWAIPAKKAGEEIGWRMEEKRAGKRLRPIQPPLKETAKYIPSAIMAGIRKKIKRQ